jgi:hypothetical protein
VSAPWLLISGASFVAALVFHAIVCRMNLRLNRVASFLAISLLVSVPMVAALARSYEFATAEFMAALLVFGFACELYVFLFTMTISSISANVIAQLARQPMSLEETMSRYDSGNMVRMRLARLVQAGFLELDPSGNRISPSAKGIWFTKAFSTLRRLFRHA